VLDLSIIVPTFDEEDNVEPLYQALMATVPALGQRFEIIFVDDGSRDRTFDRLAALAARDARVRVIKLRRNCGQTLAMAAGIDHAQGRILVTMDADLQNDPADIACLLAKLEEGHDLVVGWRHDRQGKWLSRKLPSRIANRLIAVITGVDVKDNGCTLKAFRAELIKAVPLYGELHRFIPAMASTVGCQLAEVKVRDHPRKFNKSKYGLARVYKVLFDIITVKTLMTFARRPLFCFFSIAAAALAVSAAFTVLSILFVNQSVVVFMSVAVLGGSLALFLGFAGVISSLVSQYGGQQLVPLQAKIDDDLWATTDQGAAKA
jgi:glycosyltransferase involved in cell wall biosynthesis